MDGHAGVVGQAGLADFIQTGQFGRHVRRMRKLYAERQDALVAAVERYLGGRLDLRPSHAGLHLVGRLNYEIDDRRVVAHLDARRYAPTALSTYYGHSAQAASGLVLGYAGSSPEDIEAGVAEIAAALTKVVPWIDPKVDLTRGQSGRYQPRTWQEPSAVRKPPRSKGAK